MVVNSSDIKQMRWKVVLVAICLVCAFVASSQDANIAGVWKRHFTHASSAEWDKFIRVDIDGPQVFVGIKEIGIDANGKPFQRYNEAKDITINSDGSISFIVNFSVRELDDEDHLYWTGWDRYTIRLTGKRLNVTEKGEAYGANSQGRIIKDQRNLASPKQYTYYNINDNW